jgi:hypothetical protein
LSASRWKFAQSARVLVEALRFGLRRIDREKVKTKIDFIIVIIDRVDY